MQGVFVCSVIQGITFKEFLEGLVRDKINYFLVP